MIPGGQQRWTQEFLCVIEDGYVLDVGMCFVDVV